MKKVCYYYIIDVRATKGRNGYHFYKIGESDNKNRPATIEATYTKLSKNLNSTAIKIAMEVLPDNGIKRINDKAIHRAFDTNILEHVNKDLIEGIFGETDGSDEFFELKDDSIDVCKYVEQIVDNLRLSNKGFRAAVKEDLGQTLDYGEGENRQHHLVEKDLLDKIRKFGNLKLNRENDKTILLIGQFEPDWVATFAMENFVVIMHDTKDEIHRYNFEPLNKNIVYIENTNQLLEGDLKDMKFNLIIANPPYAQKGADIDDAILSTVEFDEYISLEPVVDYLRNDLYKHVDLSSLCRIPAAFSDAEVLPSICRLTKATNNISRDEFYLYTISNEFTEKYFKENVKRKNVIKVTENINESIDMNTSMIFGVKLTPPDRSYHNLFGKKDTMFRMINAKRKTIQEAIDEQKQKGFKGSIWGAAIQFNSELERQNAYKFMHSYDGSRFCNFLVSSMGRDNYHDVEYYAWFPKVDWTKPQTVESILKDYKYSDTEIKSILNELDRKNDKGRLQYRGVTD